MTAHATISVASAFPCTPIAFRRATIAASLCFRLPSGVRPCSGIDYQWLHALILDMVVLDTKCWADDREDRLRIPDTSDGERETSFLTVDVDVLSRAPLDGLIKALGRRVLINHSGKQGRSHRLVFSPYFETTADGTVRKLARLISGLPTPARRQWNLARERVFDLGFQAGIRPFGHETGISLATLHAIARLGASLKVTIYAVQEGATAAKETPPNKKMQQTRHG